MDAQHAAVALHLASEALRTRLDDLEATLRKATELQAIDQAAYDTLRGRLEQIRAKRNGMECFQVRCKVEEIMEKAWSELP